MSITDLTPISEETLDQVLEYLLQSQSSHSSSLIFARERYDDYENTPTPTFSDFALMLEILKNRGLIAGTVSADCSMASVRPSANAHDHLSRRKEQMRLEELELQRRLEAEKQRQHETEMAAQEKRKDKRWDIWKYVITFVLGIFITKVFEVLTLAPPVP